MTIKRCFLFVLMCSYLAVSTAQISPEVFERYQCDEIEPSEPELRLELLEMERVDQEAAQALVALGSDEMPPLFIEQASRLEQSLESFDWLGIDLVGCDGANAAFLIAQHADENVPFQEIALKRLTSAVKRDQAMSWQLAYLTDRVLINTGKKQIYGTQHEMINDKLVPRPLEYPAKVDELRAEMDLGTLEDYLEISQDYLEGSGSLSDR